MKTSELVPNYQEVKQGQSWLGGPTHTLQRQAIPGYCGHIQGLEAENQHGKTFAKLTAECINERNDKGFDYQGDDRYKSAYTNEFVRPNLRNAPLQNAAERIINDRKDDQILMKQTLQQNYDDAPKSINDLPPIDRLPVVGYQGFRPVFRPPLKNVEAPPKPDYQQDDFDKLPDGIKKNLLENDPVLRKKYDNQAPPVVGYTGFQKGIKAENVFGKTFRQLSHASQQM